MTTQAVILSAVRTPIGAFGGSLAGFSASDLGAIVIKEALKRAGVDSSMVSELIMGNVLQAGQGMNPARQAGMKAGLPESVPALTINRVCGSGLESITQAARLITSGEADVVIAGGMESMSQAPHVAKKARWGSKLGDMTLEDTVVEGLTDVFQNVHMGITAENIAQQYGITREQQDTFALESQKRAAAAIGSGRFRSEIVPVEIKEKKSVRIFDTDEHPRADTTAESLAKLRPAFKPDGTVTAGNASGINDGAAALVITSAAFAEKIGAKPLARIVAGTAAGCAPGVMGLGPIYSTRKLLDRTGHSADSIDLIEGNEAFAAQTLAVMRDLKLDPAKTNVNGGAIALGHPIGCSGARITVSLVHEMIARGLHRGLATLCVGGGMGVSLMIERPC